MTTPLPGFHGLTLGDLEWITRFFDSAAWNGEAGTARSALFCIGAPSEEYFRRVGRLSDEQIADVLRRLLEGKEPFAY